MESENKNRSLNTQKSVIISQSFYNTVFQEILKNLKFPKQITTCDYDIVFHKVAICVATLGDIRRNFEMLQHQLSILGDSSYQYKVMIIYLDEDSPDLLTDINLESFHANVALFLASDTNELINYIETLCSPAPIQSKTKKITCKEALTRIKGITKRDAENLFDKYNNLRNILQQTEQDLKSCPGIGRQKARNLARCFSEAIKRM